MFDGIKQIDAGLLNVGYVEAGSQESPAVILLHGWPYDIAKLIWHIASPRWEFDDATFDRTAGSFDNPDHVDVVIHNYRWRLGLAQGEPEYDALERRLAAAPPITVPAIT